MAIFAIIALGVGFYGGLLLTQPSFIKTGDVFVRNQKLYDFRLISTIGFDDEDISKLASLDGVKAAEGAVFADAIVSVENDDSTSVARIHTLTNNVNVCALTAGRMPTSSNEMVVDGYHFSDNILGKKISLSVDNDKDTFDAFSYEEYTVVGVVRSPYYMNFQRGSSSVGNGQVSFYAYVPIDGMEHEYYTEAYLFYGTEYYIYSDEYDQWAENKQSELENVVQQIEEERFQDLLSDAKKELDDARDEFNSARDEAWQELIDANVELNDARVELNDASIELDDAQATIEDGRRDINSAQNEIDTNRRDLDDKKAEIDAGQLELDAAREELLATKETLTSQLKELKATQETLSANLGQVNHSIEIIQQYIVLGIPADSIPYSIEELSIQKAQLEAGLAECQGGIAKIEAGLTQVDTGLVTISEKQAEIDAGRALIEEGYAQIDDAQREVNSARQELDDGQVEYDDGYQSYVDGLAEYEDGLAEYRDGQTQFQNEIASAARLLGEGMMRYDISSDKEVNTYVLGRDTNIGYVSLDNDEQIVAGIARVFPIFFFALAALVCSTTMQRMVGDERTQIGTMRALGFSEFAIIMKYVVYSGLAAVLGCILGFSVGTKIFPWVIWQVYGMMYGFSPVVYANNWLIFALALGVSLLCSVGVTVFTAVSEMKGTPAELIRPKAPAAGKRILLERISFLWKLLKFTYKVSIRNVFRFKKRMFMMIVGIAGCTALLVTGFGIRDSVCDVVNIHYSKVLTYDVSVTFNDGVTMDDIHKIQVSADKKCNTQAVNVLVRNENVTHNGDAIRDVHLIVSDDPNIESACGTWIGDERLPWPGDGEVAISSKLARKNNLQAGDTITFDYGDSGESFDVKIAYVFDNYIYHYAYMNTATYEAVYGESYFPNTMYSVLGDEVSAYDYAQAFSGESDVKTWTVVEDMRSGFSETMSQMDKVVILVIACAAALAFIVLFNLNNINITERIREIATLKVLGFNRMETGSYVFRENVILVIIGFIIGIPLGIFLNAFVITQIEMDIVTFVIQIFPISYVYALGFVILFSVIVDVIMRAKIEKIDMAESLKSIE
ncbi:MAG: FtsX-like permease family protein [Saccharofermentans sp.]|nr:FtsX-like permease family protein [Saccharofermentans sp.]